MMKWIIACAVLLTCASCWPTSVSFRDTGSMPPEWRSFSVKTLDNNAPSLPLSYAATLTEAIKDGVQNRTRLKLSPVKDSCQIVIEGAVVSATPPTPIALQANDNAAKNRVTVNASFTIYITAPKADKMVMTSSRFADYDANQDAAAVEAQLLEEITNQIVQDVINKLLSNW
jgi:hypothetical protein